MSQTAISVNAIEFKPEFSPCGWMSCAIVACILLAIVLLLIKKQKSPRAPVSACQLIEKKYLSNKTIIYVIELQNQRFLLADNQHALALHALNHEATHAT